MKLTNTLMKLHFLEQKSFWNNIKTKTLSLSSSHFGLGFYSSFMVSSKVQIKTLSFKKEGSKAVQWESNGDPTYEIKEIKEK